MDYGAAVSYTHLFSVLLENGWTQEQVDVIEMTAYTGWSRSEGRRLFTEWLDSKTVEEIAEYKWIFTHDDEIAMGILEALQSSEIEAEKKDAFLAAGVHLSLILICTWCLSCFTRPACRRCRPSAAKPARGNTRCFQC